MKALQSLQNPIINHATALALLHSYARPNDKISELIKQNQLISLKRGLYAISNSSEQIIPLAANHLYGPSYLSSHWALGYYGFITERVSLISSMCVGKSQQFDTPIGLFNYHHLPLAYYSTGITRVQQSHRAFMIATPEKALADILVSTRGLRIQSTKAMTSYLLDNLRFDENDLSTLNSTDFIAFTEHGFKSGLLHHLSHAVRNLSND